MYRFYQKSNKFYSKIGNKIKLLFYTILYSPKIQLNNTWLGKSFEFDIKSSDFKLILKKNVHFRKFSTICIRNNGVLIIGENTFFNNGISINCHNCIEIGANCLFGENVKIYDHNHKFRNKNQLISTQGYSLGKICIGNNCWIGSNVIILKNVTIGDNVVIGANCVISENVLSNSIVKSNNNLQVISY